MPLPLNTFSSDAAHETHPITPTDVSQFIRLDQCERYLRLRLHERASGREFMTEYDVAPQSIPPILTRSGSEFEDAVAHDIGEHFPTIQCSDRQRRADSRTSDNPVIITLAKELLPGTVHVILQPRLVTQLDQWRLRGDVDVIRLERTMEGQLRILIADMKASTASKVEHRLQVAFYHEMLGNILDHAGICHDPIELAILYRGPADNGDPVTDTQEADLHIEQRAAALRLFGTEEGLLEPIVDVDAYTGAVHDLVIGPHSTARRVLDSDFDTIPFHLTYKCDGCLFNEFCMKRSAETDDLSLLPHLTEQDKTVLHREGITTITELATLKDLRRKGTIYVDGEPQTQTDLIPVPGKETLSRHLAATWPVGPRLDELIHRARRYRDFMKDPIESISYIPGKGYGSLPYSDAEQNPNLVRIYIDAQHDYLNDRLYMVGALIVASERGIEHPHRRRSVVRLSEASPDSNDREERLLVSWITGVLQSLVEVAAPDAEGKSRAPIHLIFINSFAQRILLDGLGRHATKILGATALYDFVTQLAAFDSPLVTFLDQQVREKKNYPMLCQSLQAVAAYLKFNWNQGTPYREIFRARLFDFWGTLDPRDGDAPGAKSWYTNRARFNSQIPLEFAYAAWGEVPAPEDPSKDAMESYRASTPDLLAGFHARRLEAMECVAHDFAGNKQTEQSMFDLPDLANFTVKAPTFAHALAEFVTIERHVELGGWKTERLAPPEQRVLAGQTLIVRYMEEDQDPGIAERNRDNEQRRLLNEAYRAEFREANPDAKTVKLTKEQNEETKWDQDGMVFRLRIEVGDDFSCDLEEVLGLTTLKPADWLVIYPRFTVDSRRPVAEQVQFTPTAKQMLYGMRCGLQRITVNRENGRAVTAFAEITISMSMRDGGKGFLFGGSDHTFQPGATYTLDADPNNINAFWASKITEGLLAGGEHTLYSVLSGQPHPEPAWSDANIAAQRRFLDGLDALHAAGLLHTFEQSKREFIGEHGTTHLMLVQGPPGTGKSYSTAFAIFARIQGAMATNIPFRVFLSCKTHAATDVLLDNVVDVQRKLEQISVNHPDLFRQYFDYALLHVPLFRLRPRGEIRDGIIPLPKDEDRVSGTPKATEMIAADQWTVVAATPGGIYGLIKDRWNAKSLFGHHLAACLVLAGASQMNLQEAVMAALPVAADGSLIVVG
ncbi:MAG: PD-(D/E)XK nuclease family protein, partial [Thermomicrobiales bacterium]